MKSSYSSVAVTGSIAYDEIMDFPSKFVDHLDPAKLHQLNVSFVVDRLEKQLGGTANNISYNFILSQCTNVKILAGMGKDHREFTEFFDKNGVDYSGSIIDESLYTATGKVITDRADNQIWGFYYGACICGKDVDFEKYTDENTAVVISANHGEAFLHAQREAIRLGRVMIYDPGMAMTWIQDDDLAEGINNAAYFVGNDYEIGQITKRIKRSVDELVDAGIVVITTLGDQGVEYRDKEQTIKVHAYKDTKIVDPTGAGDAWRGGFFGRLMLGDSLKNSLAFANALASFAVEKYGTVNHNPTFDDIKKRASIILS